MSETNAAKGGNQMKIIIGAVIVVIIVGCGSFYGGMKYASASRSANMRGAFGQAGGLPGAVGATGTRARQGVAGGGFINGDIVSMDDKSITVKSKDGSSKIVFLSGTTEIGKFVTGALSDLTAGLTVMVTGKTNSDGSVTAQSIQIRPAGSSMPGGVPQGGAQIQGNNAPTPTPGQ
jgi:hypothetical protein